MCRQLHIIFFRRLLSAGEGRYSIDDMTAMTADSELVQRFRDWLTERGRSASTAHAYAGEVERLAAWRGPEPLTELGSGELRRYLAERSEAGDSPATRNVRLAAIRHFFRWLVRTGAADGNPAADIPVAPVPETAPGSLSRDEVRALLDAVDQNPRDRSILLLVLSTGVRVGEVVRLNRSDLSRDAEGSTLTVRSASGSERTVFPSAQATESVEEYLGARDDDCEAMFVSRLGRRLATRTVQTTFATHFRRAGISGSLRSLRHTFAVHRSQSGMDVSHLHDIMGLKLSKAAREYRQTQPDKLRQVASETEERY